MGLGVLLNLRGRRSNVFASPAETCRRGQLSVNAGAYWMNAVASGSELLERPCGMRRHRSSSSTNRRAVDGVPAVMSAAAHATVRPTRCGCTSSGRVVIVASEGRSFDVDRLFETPGSAGVSAASAAEMGVTQYVRPGRGDFAFQVLSAGAVDILVVNESVMPIEALHDNAYTSSYLGRLAAWGRVIVFDRRGVGMFDAVATDTQLILADWVDDAVAVLDAVGSERAAVFSSGPSAGSSPCTSPPSTRDGSRSTVSTTPSSGAPNYPLGLSSELEREMGDWLRVGWGSRFADRRGRLAATAARHPGFVDWALTRPTSPTCSS